MSRVSDYQSVWHQSGNGALNNVLLSSRRNCVMVGTALTDDGRAFQARAAETGKARSPSVERRIDGTTRVDVEADRRRLRRRQDEGSRRGTVSGEKEGKRKGRRKRWRGKGAWERKIRGREGKGGNNGTHTSYV